MAMSADTRSILAVGLSHKTAPVEVRERAALDEEGVRKHLARLLADGIVDEALLVSTCNRVELYAVPRDVGGVRAWLDHVQGPKGESIDRYLYYRDGREAVVHLFNVAASLDSLIIGEPQILGQVKDAVRWAEESGSLGRVLGNLSRRTLAVAKRVRTETAIGRYRVGIGNAGVDLATQIFGDLSGRRALLIGVGEMGKQVAKALLDHGLAELIVANRTHESAIAVAEEYHGTAITMDRLEDYLGRADIVITAAASQQPILGVDAVKHALKVRRYHPLFLVDLAVPRNVDPAVADIDEAYLFNVDDLTRVLERGQKAREDAAREAVRIVEDEADRFLSSLREIEVGPSLGRIARRVEDLRQLELTRSRKLVEGLDAAQMEQLDALTRALVKKVLDGPLRAVRDAARDGDDERLKALLDQWNAEAAEPPPAPDPEDG
jgi:glutamyl-tRNA reductase